jgi:modification methylase
VDLDLILRKFPGQAMTKKNLNKTGTETSSFGTPGHVNHDSSKFYNSRLYNGLPKETGADGVEQAVPGEFTNRLFCKSSEKMDELPDNSIHLMVSSPPYNTTKQYDQDLTLEEFLEFLGRVWEETHRVLAPGGRACINVANLGRKPYIPLHSYIISQMLAIGYLMRGEIIWNKGASSSPSTAWGSWQSAANPVLRDVHEYILVFSKGTFSRKGSDKENSIGRDEFLEWTKSVWTFPAVSAKKIGHPAPFPEELPRRLIQLFSFRGDVVLDPFVGSGSTCLAAAAGGRSFVGYDTSQEYLTLARERIEKIR